jgi:uncharacterized protein with HEPN domain
MKDRDTAVLRYIVKYADEISGTIVRFELDLEKLKLDYVAKNAIAMCILQIGELVGHLTEGFKEKHNEQPWRDIVGMRNRAAHAYSSMDIGFLWNTAADKIPELKAYCEGILNEMESL